MTEIRKLTVSQIQTGFLKGFMRGLATSVEVFDPPHYVGPRTTISGLQLDIEALRADVGRAKTKITREGASIHVAAD